MKLCRFVAAGKEARIGLLHEDMITDLGSLGFDRLHQIYDSASDKVFHSEILKTAPQIALREARLLAPVDEQEIWAAGVTYERSKTARMQESGFSATAYDRVYEAERPELFFKALPQKVVGTGGTLGIRADARWNVPEPELALVINSSAKIVGCTIGNDMSSRDIEGENLLYLPQAKIYDGSCALGPAVLLGSKEEEVRTWQIRIEITRDGSIVFEGTTSIDRIRRNFDDLVKFLFRSQTFANGVVLLTGTGIVPADVFTLREGDRVSISIPAIGTLENVVGIC